VTRGAVAWGAHAALLALLWSGLWGCLSPADERALLDETVGQGQTRGARVAVRGGLALVTALEPGWLQLWAQAPSLELEITLARDARPDWIIAVDNCPRGSVLSVATPGAERPAARAPVPVKSGTSGRWRVVLARGATHRLRIAPPAPARPGPLRFAVLSDTQDPPARVREIFRRINQEPELAFVLSTGDLSEEGQRADLLAFRQALTALQVPFYSTVGNHELKSDEPELWPRVMGRHSLHFHFGGVAFSLLDSASATVSPLVYSRLEQWLARGAGRLHVVLTHIPPMDPVGARGLAFRSRAEAARLLAALARGGVDLTLYGHIHTHHKFTNAGIEAHISGGGATSQEKLDGVGRHFLVVEADAMLQRLDVRRVDVD